MILEDRQPRDVSLRELQTSGQMNENANCSAVKVKLPTIEIPKFGGQITEFKHFYDTFSSLIINNQVLDDVQKFHYLLSSVINEPHQLIQNLPVTQQNVRVAWKLLCDRYNNGRLIAAAHVKSLLSLPVIKKESATELRALINQFQSDLNAIKTLDLSVPLHEVLLSQILIEHVDEATRKQLEMRAVSRGVTELQAIIKFLEGKCQAFELIHASHHPMNENSRGVIKPTKHAYVTTHSSCVTCRGTHPLQRCKQFKKASLQQIMTVIKQKQLCLICSRDNHRTSQCKSEWRCKFCRRKHISLLPCQSEPAHKNDSSDCYKERQLPANRTEQYNSNQSEVTLCHTSRKRASSQTLLATAVVYFKDRWGQLVKCRALLDSASQGHFVTGHLIQQLQLKKVKTQIPVQGINETTRVIQFATSLEIKSRINDWETTIDCDVIPEITGMTTTTFLNNTDWGIPEGLTLADENFNKPGFTDVLLGAGVFFLNSA